MCPDSEQYEAVCKDEFAQINRKLDTLDNAIRGNGNPGLNSRMRRIEEVINIGVKRRWLWFGALVCALVNGAVAVGLTLFLK